MRLEGIKKQLLITIIISLFLATTLTKPLSVFASHSLVSNASLVLETMKESVTANQTITFTQTGDHQFQAGENFTITYPTGFNLTNLSSPLDFDVKIASTDETLQSTACGATDTIRVTISGQTITFTACDSYTAEAANSTIEIKIGTHSTIGGAGSNKITNQTAAQNNTNAIVTLGGTEIAGSIAVEIVTDNDVTVNATVDPSITCAFTGLTTTFTSLTTGAVSTSDTNTTITISTNANSGFNLTVRDEGNGINPGLYKSAGNTYLIGSANSTFDDTATLSASNDGFGIQGSVSGGSGGTVTIASRYNQTGNSVGGLERIATQLASASQAVSGRVITIVHKAAVSGLAPAGNYTDNLTYVCSGIF